jgi:type I restriction-modification system DNA methylase subunit
MYDFKLFNSRFAALAMHVSKFEAFNTFLDFFLLAFDPNHTEDTINECCNRLQHKDTRKILVEMISIIGEIADNAGEGFGDPLGEFFTMEITNGHNGQFFTPEPICTMMAALQPEPEEGQRISDPTCGSGRTLLAMAARNRHLIFYGADVDHVCVKMTVINFLLNSLTGEVAHMNTLSNDFYCGYKTGVVLIDGFYYPYFKKFTDPAESYNHLKLPAVKETSIPNEFKAAPATGSQGSLF